MLVALILARLLAPSDFGLAAMAFVCTSFVLTLSDASLGKALVQRPAIDELDCSTVFWTTVAIGVALTAAGIAGSGLIADAFGQPRLQPFVAVLSLSFLLVSLQGTQAALFQRNMLYREMTIRFIVSVVISGVVGIASAASGAGTWSLIAQQLTLSASSTMLLWALSPWRPRLVFSWTRLRSLSGFGIRIMGARLMDDVCANADNVLIGRFLGAAALGGYSVAYNLMTLPAARLVLPIRETLFPAYSRVQDDRRRIASIWLRSTALILALIAPLMMGLTVVAPEFVRTVLGPQWAIAIPVLRLLAPVAIFQAASSLASTTLLAINRPKAVLRLSITNTACVVAAFAVGVHWGIDGVATALLVVATPLGVGVVAYVAHALGVSFRHVVRELHGVAVVVAFMAAAILLLRWYLVRQGFHDGLLLVAVVISGGVVYVPLCIARVDAVRAEAQRVRRRFGVSRGVAAPSVMEAAAE